MKLAKTAVKVFALSSLALNVQIAFGSNTVVNSGAHAIYEAQPGCAYHYASQLPVFNGFCDETTLNQVPYNATTNNVVVGDSSEIFDYGGFGGATSNTLIGSNSHMGVAIDSGGQFFDSKFSTSLGFGTQIYGAQNVALGSGAHVNGKDSIAIGVGSSVGYLAGAPVYTTGSISLGYEANAYSNHSIAIGSGSIASEDYTVSFGNTTTRRRLTNVADAVGNYDAVNYGQMRAITDAMSTQISGLDFRVTALENAAPGGGGGGPVDLTPAYQYTDASSSQTLNSANSYTDASSAQTLSSANSYTDASSAQTLNSANAYTDAAVAGVVGEANAYTDREIAKSERFLSAGIAAVAAQPTLPALSVGQKAVAVGTGHFNGANAVGVSLGFAPRDGVVLSGGVSGVSGEGKPVFRTSASYVW